MSQSKSVCSLQERIRESICSPDSNEVTVDCTDIYKVSSLELSQLIRVYLSARNGGTQVVLINVCETIREILKLTRLDRMVSVRVDQQHELLAPQMSKPR